MSIKEIEQIIKDFFKKPVKTIWLVIIFIVLAICGFWANGYFGKIGEQAAQTEEKYENLQSGEPLPSADEITAEGRRAAPWHNEYGGVRRSYQRLLHWRDAINDPIRKDWIITEIERVEKSYPVDVMRLNIDRWGYICVQHADCKKDYEPPTGFSAQNAISHLGFNRDLWQERARAACILRNIKTSPDKDSIDKKKLYEALIRHMNDQEPSLTVSKMALETYKDLTGFVSDGVFDFAGAIKDWEKRKEEILKINF